MLTLWIDKCTFQGFVGLGHRRKREKKSLGVWFKKEMRKNGDIFRFEDYLVYLNR